MTIDEAIKHAREVAEEQRERCEQCAKDHEQLVEWLEELKDLRQAVDEFKKDIINKINFEDKWLFACKSNNADTDIVFSALRSFVNDRAEQLKEQSMNEHDLDTAKYKVCCPLCDSEKCVKGSDKCDAEIWKREQVKERKNE